MKFGFPFKPAQGARIDWGHPMTKGLVGCWLFTENAGQKVFDLARSNHLAMVGGGSYRWEKDSTFGMVVRSPATVSSDYLQAADHPSLNPTAALTYECWFKKNAGSAWQDIMAKDQPADDGQGILIDSGNHFSWFINTTAPSNVSGTTSVANGVWYHLVGTYDGANMRLYVDTVQEATGAKTGAIASSTRPLTFLNDPQWTQMTDGWIGLARVWNRALTATEVRQLYADPYLFIARPRDAALSTSGGGSSLTLNLSDSFSLSDAAVKADSKVLSDSFSLTETLAKLLGKPLSDSFSLADAKALQSGKTLSDSFTLSDSRLFTVLKALSDSFTLSDARSLELRKVLSDSFSLERCEHTHSGADAPIVGHVFAQ
jgi:hypothetical protein